MTKPQRYERTIERDYSSHHTLLEIASIQLEMAKQEESELFNSALIAITFSALAVEALANSIGDRLWQDEDWKDFESCSPIVKLRLIAEKLDIPYSTNLDPWKTIKWLIKFRNQIAHSKPEKITTRKIIDKTEREARLVDQPKSKFEQLVTLKNASDAVNTVRDLKELFCKQIPDDQLNGIIIDGWSACTEPLIANHENT